MKTLVRSVLLFVAAEAGATGAFEAAPPMTESRYSFTLTPLADGRLLAIGGVIDQGSARNTAEIFDPALWTWNAVAPMAENRSYHSALLLADGRVLVAGGNGNPRLPEVYDPSADTWTRAPEVPRSRISILSLLRMPNGEVLAIGGELEDVCAAYYDPEQNAWRQAACLGAARFDVSAVRLNDGRVLVVGGRVGIRPEDAVPTAEFYDPANDTWSDAPNPQSVKLRAEPILLKSGRVFVPGAFSEGLAEVFEPTTGVWRTTGTPDEVAPSEAPVLLQDGTVLLAGGLAVSVVPRRYEPESDRWAMAAGPSTHRVSHRAALLPDGRVMVAGGIDIMRSMGSYTPGLASTEIFVPAPIEFPEDVSPSDELPASVGCGCAGMPGAGSAAWPVLLGAVLLRRRRAVSEA
jgi:uncharacterized protein (TIGR03382 family)